MESKTALHLCFTLWQFSSCLGSLNVGGQVGRQVIGVDVDADILNMALHNSMELEVVLLSLHKAKEQSNFSFHKYAYIDVGYQRLVLVQVAHFRSDLRMVQFCNAVLSLMDAIANCCQCFSPKLSHYCHEGFGWCLPWQSVGNRWIWNWCNVTLLNLYHGVVILSYHILCDVLKLLIFSLYLIHHKLNRVHCIACCQNCRVIGGYHYHISPTWSSPQRSAWHGVSFKCIQGHDPHSSRLMIVLFPVTL